MLVWKLVHLHKGKIHLSSIEHQGSIIKVTFPKDNKQFRKAHLTTKTRQIVQDEQAIYSTSGTPDIYEKAEKEHNENQQRLLIVEDNDELRNYLGHTLSDMYTIQMCSNGKEALTIVKEYKPGTYHLRHHDAGNAWRRTVCSNQERYRDITHSNHPAYCIER